METYHSNMARRRVLTLLAVSLAPIPFSTFGSKEQSQIGQNYLRSLLALKARSARTTCAACWLWACRVSSS